MDQRLARRLLKLRRRSDWAPLGRAERLAGRAFDRLGWLGAACAIGALCTLLVGGGPAHAEAQAPQQQRPQPDPALLTGNGSPAPVVASGEVPDEATRAAVLQRLRAVYGEARVVDRIQVGAVVAPASWSAYVGKLLTPGLRQVSRGSLAVRGNEVALRGEVANEARRQQLASDLATSLNPTYTVRNQLQVAAPAPGGQHVLDGALAGRIVEFQPGSAVLTPAGRLLLDQMAAAVSQAIAQADGRGVEIVGHTDANGERTANLLLSQARADAVKAYLVDKGIAADRVATLGAGAQQPVADNTTPEGRARNRRIEFRSLP